MDGVKPGRIQFIGDTKFGQGEWAGVFLDEPIGKNDILLILVLFGKFCSSVLFQVKMTGV